MTCQTALLWTFLLIHTLKSSLLIKNSLFLYHTFSNYIHCSPYAKLRIIFNLPLSLSFLPYYFCTQYFLVPTIELLPMQSNHNKVSSSSILEGCYLFQLSAKFFFKCPYNSQEKALHSSFTKLAYLHYNSFSNCKTLN